MEFSSALKSQKNPQNLGQLLKEFQFLMNARFANQAKLHREGPPSIYDIFLHAALIFNNVQDNVKK